jgi:hypothetical protein
MKISVKDIKVYLVSPGVDKYKHRLQTVFERLVDSGFKQIEFVRSVPGSNGTDSLSRTNLEIFKKELSGPSRPFLIVEDDVAISTDYESIEVPEDADAVYFGVSKWVYPHSFETLGRGYHIRTNSSKDVIDSNVDVTRIKGMTSTHAILFINQVYIHYFIELMSKRLSYITPHDLVFATMHGDFHIYALKNPMFYQDKTIGGQEDVTRLSYNSTHYS